jgi:RecB family exonuclease
VPTQLSLFDLGPAPEPPSPPPPSPAAPAARAVVWVVHGARAAEALLLERLEVDLAAAAREPRLLARPVRVVVPSRSLSTHLAARLVARRGRGLAGVNVQTLYGVACEILERAGEPVPRGTLLFEVLAERAARAEPALARGLEGLVDGYAGVFGTVRDLLDSGFERAHAEAVDEFLAALGPGVAARAPVERARALVRVAARVESEGLRLGVGRASHLFRRAAELVAIDPERFLPARVLYVHGFADATGLATDLLTAFLRRPAARLLLDRPPDPVAPSELGPDSRPEVWEAAFTERFTERLALLGVRFEESRPRTAPPERARLARLEAAGTEAEVRGVALRIAALLDAGVRPEGIGVVARDLVPYRLALGRHLGRLGIPFSGLGTRGAVEPGGRRAAALLELLRRREETPCDRWLDAAVSLPGSLGGERLRLTAGGRRRIDLRLAVRALGAGRLRDLAALEPAALARLLRKDGRYPLPIRQGLRTRLPGREEEGEDEGEGAEAPAASRATARTVAGEEIERAAVAARALCRRFAEWPETAPAGEHLAQTAALLAEDLGWTAKAPDPVALARARMEREIPPGFRLHFAELRLLFARALAEAGRAPLGGRGGGVQVLSVTEARSRTFEHLFLIGMNRDLFPRTVREDPLLPDSLRAILAGPLRDGVLPDVPVKRRGFDEERYLFAQLLSAAPAVTLSWQSADDDGRPRSPSPLVERLLAPLGAERLPPLYARPAPANRAPYPEERPADEHAILAALHGPRPGFGRVLPLAFAEGRALLPPAVTTLNRALDPRALAAARVAVLDELDPDLRGPEGRATRARLGPWFGFVGGLASLPRGPEHGDPRRKDLWVTQLEGMAACPWQTFLTRLLGLEPTPDPLEALPGVGALVLGNLVHRVLEEVVLAAAPAMWREGREEGGGPPWEARPPISVPWPAAEGFERLLRAAALRVVEEEGISLPGMARALAERARPFLEVARQIDWGEGTLHAVLGAEVYGRVEVADSDGHRRPIRFKADRVDEVGGELLLTDYKTGRPLSTAKTPAKRAEHLLKAVRAGARLQAVAYQLGSARPARGRYLFLRPELEERDFAAGQDTPELERAFAAATAAVLGAWDAGTFFPRVVDITGHKEPGRCGFCGVAEACLRGDSGARGRMFEWASREGADGDPAAAAVRAVWRLPAAAEKNENGVPGKPGHGGAAAVSEEGG